MKQWIKSLVVLAICGFSSVALAVINTNKNGAAGVAITMGTATPVVVFTANQHRLNWMFYSNVGMYCMPGTYSGGLAGTGSGLFTAPATAPSAGATPGVGMYFSPNVYFTERQLMLQAYANGPQAFTEDEAKVELDCIGITAGYVWTWDETTK